MTDEVWQRQPTADSPPSWYLVPEEFSERSRAFADTPVPVVAWWDGGWRSESSQELFSTHGRGRRLATIGADLISLAPILAVVAVLAFVVDDDWSPLFFFVALSILIVVVPLARRPKVIVTSSSLTALREKFWGGYRGEWTISLGLIDHVRITKRWGFLQRSVLYLALKDGGRLRVGPVTDADELALLIERLQAVPPARPGG